jgi:Spy/CpxP family protein refolding chaperone
MKKLAIILALALGVSAWSIMAQDQGGSPPSAARPFGREGGLGGPGGPGGRGGFHLLPPRAIEELNLTADQQKQITALETEMKAKLEKILTPEQLKQLQQMRPPPPRGGMGGGGPGGGGPVRGQDGPGGETAPKRPAQE